MTAIGAATAIIVGCVGITPAARVHQPGWAMALGALAALPSYAVIVLRPRTRVDETLDVLAAHGIAGLTGILFIGFFAQAAWNGIADGLLYGNAEQLADQALAALAAPAYAFGMTYVLLRLIGAVMPLRATEPEEAIGMDIIQHGEEAYVTGEGAILIAPSDLSEKDRRKMVADRAAARSRARQPFSRLPGPRHARLPHPGLAPLAHRMRTCVRCGGKANRRRRRPSDGCPGSADRRDPHLRRPGGDGRPLPRGRGQVGAEPGARREPAVQLDGQSVSRMHMPAPIASPARPTATST